MALTCSSAWAQGVEQAADESQSSGTALEDIVVTAQRRSERLQDVPIAVTAATAAKLEAAGVTNTMEVAQITPGLQMRQTAGNAQLNIRGIGSNAIGPGIESPTAVYIDGVYIASTVGSLFNLSNIERVEVLKGPQGTLFGRNATGGLMQVVTAMPKHEFSGKAALTYGNYQTGVVDLYATGGATETLAADFALHYARQGKGWGKNLNTGGDVYRDDDDLVIRSKILWEPGDKTSFLVTGDYSYKKSSKILSLNVRPGREDTAGFNLLYAFVTNSPPQPLGGFYEVNQSFDPEARVKNWGFSLEARHDFGGAELKSISAVRDTNFFENFDLDDTPQGFVHFVDGVGHWRQYSQELQLSSTDGGPLQWTLGAYYFHAKDAWEPFHIGFGQEGASLILQIPGATSADQLVNSQQKTNSYAGYGQATWEFLPETRLTLGGRYTHETRAVGGTSSFLVNGFPLFVLPVPTPGLGIPSKATFNNFSYRIALDHNITDDVMIYASYNTGFKSGGYNLQVPENGPFKPEKIKAAEAGLKMELFDRRMRLNMAAFYYKYRNIQVGSYRSTAQIIYNGAAATIKGFDMDAEVRVTSGLTLTGGLSYVHDRFTAFPNADYSYSVPDCDFSNPSPSRFCQASAKGNKLANSPTFTGNIGFNWEQEIGAGKISLNSNLYHSSGYFGTVDNNPRARQTSYDVLNAALSWSPESEAFKLTIWGKNLLDKKYSDQFLIGPGGIVHTAASPLTYGATLNMNF